MPFKLRSFKGASGLTEKRRQEFIIEQFKPLVLKLGGLLADVLPNPSTDIYIRFRNTEGWIELRNKWLACEGLDWIRVKAFTGMWNFLILVQEYNTCYAQRAYRIMKWWNEMEWQEDLPQRNWREIENVKVKSELPME